MLSIMPIEMDIFGMKIIIIVKIFPEGNMKGLEKLFYPLSPELNL